MIIPSFPFPLLRSPGYSDEKIARLTKEAIHAGFNHFKMKVGADLADDLRRGRLIRSIIDDPQWQQDLLPPDVRRLRVPDGPALAGKNAGPTGAVLMIDANQVWDVQQAIDYVSSLAEIKPWCARAYYTIRYSFSRSFLDASEEMQADGLFVCARMHSLGSLRSPRRRTTSLDTRPYVAH